MLAVIVREGNPWAWEPHPEVWLLVAGLAVLYWYAMTRIGPRVCRPGEKVVTKGQVAWFVTMLVLLEAASDWPIHDIGEEYLYSIHMLQHELYMLVIAPLALLATPTWLARLVIGRQRTYRVIRSLSRLAPATAIFNAVIVLTHWPYVVNHVVQNGPMHYSLHALVLLSALLVWLPVCGPLPELRFSLPVQMVHLFLQSVIPTIPAGWLTMADGVVYKSYDVRPRVFGLTVVGDQQMAGMGMKVLAGFYLWIIISVLFFRFAANNEAEGDAWNGTRLDRRAPMDDGVLTWEDVQRQLAAAPPPIVESERG